MKKTADSDSQADAVAAVLLVLLAVAFPVALLACQHHLYDQYQPAHKRSAKQQPGNDIGHRAVAGEILLSAFFRLHPQSAGKDALHDFKNTRRTGLFLAAVIVVVSHIVH